MSLQQQIQKEIDEEARIEKKIERVTNCFIKRETKNKYAKTYNRKDADACIMFDFENPLNYNFILMDGNTKVYKLMDEAEQNKKS